MMPAVLSGLEVPARADVVLKMNGDNPNRVLVVDDSRIVRELLAAHLRSNHFAAGTADVAEAARVLESSAGATVVLLNVTGPEGTARITRLARPARRVNVVAYGVDDSEEAVLACFEAGAAGYLPLDGGLMELYRRSHALLHVSWTEGVPQVLFEAFASALPVVATAVGGVPEAVGDDALLVTPGDAEGPMRALERIAHDAELRERLVAGGLQRARSHTLESETARVARFMATR